MILNFGVADDAFLIDHEGGALGHATHDQVRFGEELLVGDTVGLGDFVFVVAEELDGDAFFFRPCRLRERVVAGNPDHLGVEVVVDGDAFGNIAKLGGADAGEGHRHEEKNEIGLADELGEFHEFWAFRAFRDEGEVRGFVADIDCHDVFEFVVVDSGVNIDT